MNEKQLKILIDYLINKESLTFRGLIELLDIDYITAQELMLLDLNNWKFQQEEFRKEKGSLITYD